LKIAVLVKQVPATDKVKIDEKTGTMVRSGFDAELNPLDMYAVEEAVRIKENFSNGATVVAISMGPPSAKDVLKDAISMGCDEAYLVSDRVFAGSDTLATSYVLSAALRKFGPFDIIFAGERATDGETGQIGPQVAARLGIPAITYVSSVKEISQHRITVERLVEMGKETIQAELPALLTVVKEINEPRVPDLAGKIRASVSNIPVIGAESLNIDVKKVGLNGSPTRVIKVFYPKLSRNGKIIAAKNVHFAVKELINFLKEKSII